MLHIWLVGSFHSGFPSKAIVNTLSLNMKLWMIKVALKTFLQFAAQCFWDRLVSPQNRVDFSIFKNFLQQQMMFCSPWSQMSGSVIPFSLSSVFAYLLPHKLPQEMRYPHHLGAVTKDICFQAAGDNKAESTVNRNTSPLHWIICNYIKQDLALPTKNWFFKKCLWVSHPGLNKYFWLECLNSPGSVSLSVQEIMTEFNNNMCSGTFLSLHAKAWKA